MRRDWPSRCWSFLVQAPTRLAVFLVRLYQKFISPLLGPTCRFHPSCSHYYIASVHKYGLLKGSYRGLLRILRCHPFHPGGYDPP